MRVRVVRVLVAALILGLLGVPSASANAPAAPGGVSGGLVMWLDANDLDGDGATNDNPVQGASVLRWTDKWGVDVDESGTVRSALPMDPQRLATYQRNSINGFPTLRFTRIDDANGSFYEYPLDIRAVTREDITVFAVYKPNEITTDPPNNGGIWGNDDGGWDRFFIGYADGVDGLMGAGVGVGVFGAGEPSVPKLSVVRFDGKIVNGVNQGDRSKSNAWINGMMWGAVSDITDSASAQSTFRIGTDGDDSALDGDIAEIIVYERALTDLEVRAVSDYLGAKYGLLIERSTTLIHPEVEVYEGDPYPVLPTARLIDAVDPSNVIPITSALPCVPVIPGSNTVLPPKSALGTYNVRCAISTPDPRYVVQTFAPGYFKIVPRPVVFFPRQPAMNVSSTGPVGQSQAVSVKLLEGLKTALIDSSGSRVSRITTSSGTYAVTQDGKFSFEPSGGFTGAAPFVRYVIYDENQSSTAAYTATVTPKALSQPCEPATLTVSFKALQSKASARDVKRIRDFVSANCHYTVNGHVQPTRSVKNDKELSQRRAQFVAGLLSTRERSVVAVGKGRTHVQECRAVHNRCVVIRRS